MGVICLAASIEKWNLHKRIALRMVMIAGAKPGMWAAHAPTFTDSVKRSLSYTQNKHTKSKTESEICPKCPYAKDLKLTLVEQKYKNTHSHQSIYFSLVQVGAGLHVLHSVSVHVAQQHVHHSHGDAHSRGRPAAADLHRSGRQPQRLRNRWGPRRWQRYVWLFVGRSRNYTSFCAEKNPFDIS